ncbi:MAG TPA: hypothetical protein VMW43_00540 [Bacteroidota bacterium]|nr:hypothetical protein [Bacteroidota bacterium]
MTSRTLALILLLISLLTAVASGQDKMTRDQWQSAMTAATAKVADLQAQLTKLQGDKTALTAQSAKLDADLRACEDALYALLGVSRAEADAFVKELADIEKRVDELQKMGDAELLSHRDELERIQLRLKELSGNKMALIPRFGDKIRSLQEKVAAMLQGLSTEKTYTVGSWSRTHDCLWNIARKKDIYDNAWLWPKIWQANRDKIRDPDVIKPKWVLKVPEKKDLTKEEKAAANRYYRKKAAAPSGE